ncbi:hypothetical protein CTZ27_37030 [Streptomyces griseocarneus]|nr:hypothetical protein CTZ27_37030 [Streptomyces griseocarneus]
MTDPKRERALTARENALRAKHTRKPHHGHNAPALPLLGGSDCWCGQPGHHDWPGKDSGKRTRRPVTRRPGRTPLTTRVRLDDLTDDQLDALYTRLELLETFTDVVALELDDWENTSPARLRRELVLLNATRTSREP